MNPKVFLSHASEDKERFVVDFAVKLRAKGIDAWLDRWEMLPGDSLVEKIFEEGLKNATAVIIVLSTYSVNKPWVKEELNAGIIAKLNKGTKIIPVLLDNCDVPESLKSTLWEKIEDTTSYEKSLDRIVASVFGHSEKPPLGSPPQYTTHPIFQIAGLTRIDNLVLKIGAETDIKNNSIIIEPETILSTTDIPPNELEDALDILEQQGYVNLLRHLGPGPYSFRLSLYGMDQYAKTYITDYQNIISEVAICIVNKNLTENDSISNELRQPVRLVNHILDLLEHNGQLKLAKSMGSHVEIYNVSVSLKRALR